MADTADLIGEFKQAKPPEKALIIVVILAVIGITVYLYKKGGGGGTPATWTQGAPTTQQSGYPTVGSAGTPVLPSGVNPIFDPNGNLIAFQNPGGNVNGPLMNKGDTGAQGPPGAKGPPGGMRDVTTFTNWFSNVVGKLGYGTQISPGGVDYSLNAQRFWTSKNNFFYAPIGSTIAQGAQGRVWLNLPMGQPHQLLTGPGMIPAKTNVAKTAAGGQH